MNNDEEEKERSSLRHFVFPFLLGVVYLIQLRVPGFFGLCALSEKEPRWWQFFANGFLSGNLVHLSINALGMWVVCSQFADKIRLRFVFLGFLLFSAASSFLYFTFFMPKGSLLVGASSGIYSLLGAFGWIHRDKHFCFFGVPRLSAPVFLLVSLILGAEIAMAFLWVPALAWPLHLIAFGIGMAVAVATCSMISLKKR
ncbi:MAG: rhomboid family intramembrane serine protease [Verrucomicrobiota bacterium]